MVKMLSKGLNQQGFGLGKVAESHPMVAQVKYSKYGAGRQSNNILVKGNKAKQQHTIGRKIYSQTRLFQESSKAMQMGLQINKE